MKNIFTSSLFMVLILLFSACKKDKERDYSSLAELEQSTTLPFIDSATAMALYDAVAAERTLLLNQLETDYPGLKAQMDYDAQQIAQTDDSMNRKALIDDFVASYHAQVSTSWNNSGISIAALTAKYNQILGNIPFTVGEFGQVITDQVATVVEYKSPFPDDSVTTFSGTPLFNSDNNCAGIVISQNTQDEFTNHVRMFTTTGGGCWTRNSGGGKINVPPTSNYKHVHTRFDTYGGWFECISWAVGGGSVAGAKLSMYSLKYPVGTPVSREIVSVSAVAPLIWYAQVIHQVPATTILEISVPTEQPFYSGEYRSYLRTENYVSTGGAITGTHSEADFEKRQTVIRMVK